MSDRQPLDLDTIETRTNAAIGDLADAPQHTQEAQNRIQTASDRAALAEVAQAAHRLSQAICDWLDLKEDQ